MALVVECTEHLRDGEETFARIVKDRDAVIELIDKVANGYAGCNYTFRVFELGPEVPVSVETKVTKKTTSAERRVAKWGNTK